MRFQGGGNFSYRLRIGDFPCVTCPYPMRIQRGVSAQIAFASSAAQEAQPIPVNIAADAGLAWLPLGAKSAGGKSSSFAVISVGATPETLEAGPNNDQAQ